MVSVLRANHTLLQKKGGTMRGHGSPSFAIVFSEIHVPPAPNTPLVSGYHVDPLLQKDVFIMENPVFPNIP